MGFQFEVVYKPRPENKADDALSHQMSSGELGAISISPLWVDFPTIRNKFQQDAELSQLSSQIQSDPTSMSQYVQREGLVLFKGRLILPKTSAIIPALVAEFHSTAIRGHSGFTKTYKRQAVNFYWKGMKIPLWITSTTMMYARETNTRPCLQLGYCNPS